MKIEKKKTTENTSWNVSAKRGLAVLMGIAASSFLASCDDSSSATEESPSSGSTQDDSKTVEPAQSSDSGKLSSSNQVIVDIPKSSSSFSDEVLSSITEAAQSSALNPTSSAFEPLSSSAIPASSSSEPASSSSDIQILQPNTSPSTWQPDTNSYIRLCPDGTGNCMGFSMVTTFERTDVDV